MCLDVMYVVRSHVCSRTLGRLPTKYIVPVFSPRVQSSKKGAGLWQGKVCSSSSSGGGGSTEYNSSLWALSLGLYFRAT